MSIEQINAKQKMFVVRPWHTKNSSLYPYSMDGVEYVEAVIRSIRNSVGRDFEVRVDEDVFVPGQTLRENVERELTDASITVVILDGLRPNVVYELGFAYGLRGSIGKETNKPVFCIAEKDATVLVRNFFDEPLSALTTTGSRVTLVNPRLNLSAAFSDASDLMVLRYDRLNLSESLEQPLLRLISESQRNQDAPLNVVSELGEEADVQSEEVEVNAELISSDELNLASDDYRGGKFDRLVSHFSGSSNPQVKKLLALALMKLGRIFEASEVWLSIIDVEDVKLTAFFHLGICKYIVGKYSEALFLFDVARQHGFRHVRMDGWIERCKKRLPDPEGNVA